MPTVTIYIRDEDYTAFLKLRDKKKFAEFIHKALNSDNIKVDKKQTSSVDKSGPKEEWSGPVYRDKKKTKI